MKFQTSILAATLLAGGALSAPSSRSLERIRARSAARQSHPMDGAAASPVAADPNAAHRATDSKVSYSKNWSGAVLEQPPASASYTAVSATITVPEATAVAGVSGTQASSAWVGIDGDTYANAILQTGVDFYVDADGTHSYDAWYEWYPDNAHGFDLAVNRGDVVVVRVESTSPSEGVAIIENQTSGKSVSTTLKAPTPTATLAGQNAEWIVEDFQSGQTMIPLADFGRVAFTGAEAKAGGKSYGLSNATIIDMEQDGKIKTHTTIVSDSEVTVEYVRT
ncbi:aspergillopepsin-2 [Aspergillus udagawae]|uniref:Aspergillopepsin-2 n=1 Tax=Aspergillus udagawae TaxID=91492 RepID=A0A8E0R2A8_9EURO|nr:uncharacterized protein Aud_009678 [Aspergillus udagawae]GFF36781.1 aspergillopepsin-2 [Aspergillus udagawae]GFF97912.1 aspergillopepsin-2 [Aspergillus udagawae]GFG13337.1 aspergillopepsin-2 [Aspergillus udagawae]GFG20759.1 aspergillopepsin-2 [Aspergillus udagawae]GIC93196.1 hypothetical protein Aud_009678 [Aspergillus udagawae]